MTLSLKRFTIMQKQNYKKQKIIAMPLINLCAAIKKKNQLMK